MSSSASNTTPASSSPSPSPNSAELRPHEWRWHATGAGMGWVCHKCDGYHRFTTEENDPPALGCSEAGGPYWHNAKAHAPRSAGAGVGRGVGVLAWGGHENWAADRGCHAATCSWKEIPRKHGCIHGRSSPNPPPAQVTKPAPRRIGGTQAHKLLLMGCGAHDRTSCHIQLRLSPTRPHVIIAGLVMSPPQTHQARTA
jgi:hypothetical protein